VHDCLPQDRVSSCREPNSSFWSGDVWKLVICLRDHRPDLEITLLDVKPSGLCLIGGLQPGDTTLRDNYPSILERYLPMDFQDWVAYRARVSVHEPILCGDPPCLSSVRRSSVH